MFMYVNVDLKLQRQYAETWVFRMFSCCVRQGKYILGLGNHIWDYGYDGSDNDYAYRKAFSIS